MRSAFSEIDIQKVLEEVPRGMDALYERTLKSMSQINLGKHLIKAILLWAVCAIRPLTLKELEYALKLGTGESVLALERFITSTCGQLVQVDKSGRVSLIHETVGAFLLQEDLKSEFAVDKSGGHGKIADTCLQYLSSDEMRRPRSQKLMQVYRAKTTKRSPFVDYACLYFSQHLRRSYPEDVQRFVSLSQFLEGNVCSWIEHMARTGNLQHLVRTARDLKGFLQTRAKYHSPVGKDVQRANSWESDLIRLAAQFGRNLNESPSAIFWLIPPFCPPMTAIGAQFALTPHGIIVTGLSSDVWSDRASCMHYRDRQAGALACADASFAVGLSDKSVKVYSRLTCQEIQQLNVTQPAKLLLFSSSGKLIAVSSVHYITMFSLDSEEQLWQIRLPQECLALMFADQDKTLWLVTKAGLLLSLSVSDGSRFSLIALNNPSDEEDETGLEGVPYSSPIRSSGWVPAFTSAAFSPELSMVAAVQRGRPIGLYDMGEGTFFGLCERETDTELERTNFALLPVLDFIFNPNQAANSIAALYHDGDLVLFDPCELSLKAHVQANAKVLACSPDGRTLGTGNVTGSIQIFEFDSPNLIYEIIASDYSITSLAFSGDSLQFLDTRGCQCNVW